MRPNITIAITDPYVTIEEFCRRSSIPMSTARDMIRDGRLPVREKSSDMKRGKVFINMVALTLEAVQASNIANILLAA
ncbi:regulator [Photorhabdus sp. SF281]|uniref:regulator n=1 Tax=Photorhabdus sp. SF281 TaxID=3459527 RepID=UPI004044217B